jgi:hypothetical protein
MKPLEFIMANRAMAAKVERAKREGREAAAKEFGKAFYGVRAYDRTREHEAIASEVARYLDGGGQVKRIACTGKSPERGQRSQVCLGDTTPGRAVLLPGIAVRGVGRVQAGESRLLPAKVT